MTGYRRQINRLMDLAAYFTARIRETEGYELVVDPVSNSCEKFQILPLHKGQINTIFFFFF